MKTKMKTILLVALMFGTLIGYANNNDNEVKAKKTVKVEFNNVKKGQTLTIKSENGIQVYNQKMSISGNYSRTFNFSALEDGIYTAELNKAFEIIIKKFAVKNGLVTFLNNTDVKIFKPVIRAEDNLLYISKLTFDKESLDITIFYNDEEILSETVTSEELLNRAYKLSENKEGDYKVVVNSDDRTYVKSFTI
ncbi:hypothetical protein [Polaribacter sp. Hel1_85]|uniref:hypothetical protein n=1 Tax=Polaribacter sp. Hel1_85 TaxID=1250005 RepID=UPI00052E30BD|nr:hypothetical protein [Polaribacter sp. Hel1_85]KGL62006.1 hypothetical protein PHEL85_1793 [Polaribacter sp. Hel1_85]